MVEEVPCCMADAARKVERIMLTGGAQVGVVGLKDTLKSVADLGLENEKDIKAALIESVRATNYIPITGVEDYATALYSAYLQLIGKGDPDGP